MTKTVLKPLKTISPDGQLQQLLVREANPKKPRLNPLLKLLRYARAFDSLNRSELELQ